MSCVCRNGAEDHCDTMIDYGKYSQSIKSDKEKKQFLERALTYVPKKCVYPDTAQSEPYCIGYSKNSTLNPSQMFWTGRIKTKNGFYKAEITENICAAKIYDTEEACLTDLLLLKQFCRNDGLFFLVNIVVESPADRLSNMEESKP